MRREEEEELERQEGCFPAPLPVEVTQTGNSPPGAAQERSRRADATLGGGGGRRAGPDRTEPSGAPGRTETDGPLLPPGSAVPGSRRRAGEQRFPGPGSGLPAGWGVGRPAAGSAAASPPSPIYKRFP